MKKRSRKQHSYELLTEESIITRVNKIIEEVKFLDNLDVTLIKIGELNGKKTKLYFHCNIHDVDTETTYTKLKDTHRFGCTECNKDRYKQAYSTRWWMSRETAEKTIQDRLEKFKELGQDLEFLGFVESDPKLFKNNDYKVIVRCKKHDKVGTPRVCKLYVKGYYCEECTIDLIKSLNTMTPRAAYEYATSNKKFNYDYSRILFEYTGYNNPVTIVCPNHGPFTVMYNTIIRGLAVCPVCYEENLRLISENKVFLELQKYVPTSEINRKFKIPVVSSLLTQTVLVPDFYIPNKQLIIEYDGKQHYNFVKYFHGNQNGFVRQVLRDNYLNNYCTTHNIRLVRIPWVDFPRIEEILKELFMNNIDVSTKIRPHLLPIKI